MSEGNAPPANPAPVRAVPPPLPQKPPASAPSGWAEFLSLTGGSIFYCLSALCIIYGISHLLGPLLSKPTSFGDALPCLGALNGYELALLGVLTLIVLWQNITDDAISLVVIMVLFLIGTGMALSTVANTGHQSAALLGLGCLFLGVGKLAVLRRFIRMALSPLLLAGLGIILAWNFLTASWYAREAVMDALSGRDWLAGGWILLAGALLLTVDALCRCGPNESEENECEPFLRQPAMAWIFVMLLLVAAGVHQYVLGYVFEFKRTLADYLPLVSMIALIAVAISLTLREKVELIEMGLALIPLGYFGLCVLTESVSPDTGWLCLPWRPVCVMAVTGLALLVAGLRVDSFRLAGLSAIYLLGVILTVGFSPAHPSALNWRLAGGLLTAGLLAWGLYKRNIAVCLAAAVIATLGLRASGAFLHPVLLPSMSKTAAAWAFLSLATIGLGVFFGRRMPRALLVAASLILVLAVFSSLPRVVGWKDCGVTILLVLLAGELWLRTRHWPSCAILGLPLLQRGWIGFGQLAAWRFVILSFILLAVGAWVSILKGKQRNQLSPPATKTSI